MDNQKITIKAIDKRYSGLSETTCCLSCGGALNYAAIEPGFICVDLGSGRGTDVIRMAEMTGKDGFVYGIDISDGMIDKAKKNAEKFGITNVSFMKCELEKLKLDNETVDIVLSNCTINHAEDKQKVWNEIHRILKADAGFIISDIYSTDTVPEIYRNDPQAVAECWAGAVTRDEYLTILKKAGFDTIEIIEESAPYTKGEIEVASWTIKGKK